jgi:hypothetical protein
MRRPSKRTIRVVAVAILLVGSAVVAGSILAAGSGPSEDALPATNASTPASSADNGPPDEEMGLEEEINGSDVSTVSVPPDAEVTVVATQGFFVSDENADLVAFTRSGDVVYHDDTYRVYFDVDPVAGTRYTVEYVASKQLNGSDCRAFDTAWCTDNVVERVNLSTGDVERVWSNRTSGIHSTRYHDVDRLNETHLVVADIHEDRVFVVDTRDGEKGWTWSAEDHYSEDQGGNDGDWTHINDVDVLPDGRFMVSVRNMNEVVFLEPGEGVDESWTLGSDDDHSVLYEQHNPDYIPKARGGPAVLVGDSENNRVVEYRRVDGEWTESWHFRDLRMQWPRDADRLPSDNTLVVDSHGDRVMEVSPDLAVVWSVEIGMPYDAERLGTGDESTGGDALPRDEVDEASASLPWHTRVALAVKDLLPSLWVNSALYVAPSGIRFGELLVLLGVVLDVLVWGVLEYRWSEYSVRSGLARARDRVTALRG